MLKFKNIGNIIFDFDGVIADTENFQLNIWKGLLKEKKLPLINSTLDAIAGIPDFLAISNLCPGLKEEDYRGLVKEKKEIFNKSFDMVKPVPGIAKIFKSFLNRKRFFICSNSSRDFIDSFMGKYFPDIQFNLIVSKGDFKKKKPDPEPYLVLLKRAGITSDDTVVFEDSVAGVISASQVGLHVIYLNRYNIYISDVPHQIKSFDELNIRDEITDA